MKKIHCMLTFVLCLCGSVAIAQNDLDSALVVTEIAGEEMDGDSAATTWTFTNGSGTMPLATDSTSADLDIDDMEDIFQGLFEGLDGGLEGFGKTFERLGWLLILLPILLFFVLPILLVLIIVYAVHKGRKAKYRAYQKMAEQGLPLPDDAAAPVTADDQKLRDDGVRTICVGIGLAFLLGLIMDELGIGIGALIFFIGVGKYAVYWLGQRDKKNR